jgi:hypothetical protein
MLVSFSLFPQPHAAQDHLNTMELMHKLIAVFGSNALQGVSSALHEFSLFWYWQKHHCFQTCAFEIENFI